MNPDTEVKLPPPPAIDPAAMGPMILQLACKYLLYERAEETALSAAFASLVAERHKEFHQKHVDKDGNQVDWSVCSNQVCKDATEILARTRRKEVFISPLAAELMGRYVVGFMPTPTQIVVRLEEKNSMQLPDTAKEKREASRIIIPS
jgi:hypothetical protein